MEFDLRKITDQALQVEYNHLLSRGRSVADALRRHYGPDRPLIRMHYADDQQFNASADKAGSDYAVGISAAVPLFLLILFGRLLSDKEVLPWLDASGQLATDLDLPAIIDPGDFNKRAQWQIKLTPIRAFASGTLSDICSTFVVLHELGHIVSGHVEGIEAFDGEVAVAEFYPHILYSKSGLARRQAWEVDADSVACELLLNYLDELWQETAKNERVRAVFGEGSEGLARIVALAITALFSLFCYLQRMRDELNLKSTHPPPLVRAYCARDYLMLAARRRWDFNFELADLILDEQLDLFMIVLERLGLFNPKAFSEGYTRQVERQVARIKRLQKTYRPSCGPWCWIEWGRPD